MSYMPELRCMIDDVLDYVSLAHRLESWGDEENMRHSLSSDKEISCDRIVWLKKMIAQQNRFTS